MFWIVGLLIAFWGLPLLVMIALGAACLLSRRLRTVLWRVIGIDAGSAPSRVEVARADRNPRGRR